MTNAVIEQMQGALVLARIVLTEVKEGKRTKNIDAALNSIRRALQRSKP